MKKLTMSLVILAVLGIGTPSSGNYLLIYNASFTIKGVDNVTPATAQLKAFIVMDFDESHDNLVDTNMIMYAKNAAGSRVYVCLNENDSNDFLDMSANVEGQYIVLDFDTGDPFNFDGMLLGKRKMRNIGLVEDMNVAGSMKGVIRSLGGVFLNEGQEIRGTATVTAALSGPLTKTANQDPPMTTNAAVALLRATLEGKGYQQFSPTP